MNTEEGHCCENLKFFSYSFKDVLTTVTHSKQSCIKFLQKQCVIPNEMRCPGPVIGGKRQLNCGHYMHLKIVKDRKDGVTWRCRRKHSGFKNGQKFTVKDVKLSIRHGTWLEDAKLTLECIVELLYLWSRGFSNSEIKHELKISDKTCIEWLTYVRESICSIMIANSRRIGGNGVEVEIDESKFGKRKYHKGKRVEGQWIFGGREKYDKSKVFMVPVEDRKEKTLIPIIQAWIEPGTIIHSDCWKSYTKLSKLGYTHLTVNHSKQFKDPETCACTNGIESDWRHAKLSMPRYGCHRGLHSGYLAEFMWRRMHEQNDRFIQVIKDLNASYKQFCTEDSM